MSWSLRSAQNGSVVCHYGVLGMKWGVRKDTSSGSTKSKSSSKKNSHAFTNPEVQETIGSKERVSYTDHGGNASVYGYAKTIKNKNGETKIEFDGSLTRRIANEIFENKKDKYGYMSESEASQKLKNLPKIKNPSTEMFRNYAVNQDGPTTERLFNCFECVVATEMRTRGYDVQANVRNGGNDLEYRHAFDVKDAFTLTSSSLDEAYKQLSAQCLTYGEGARGSLGVSWPSGGGHAISWEVKDGEFIIFDNQRSSRDGYEVFSGCDYTNIRVTRLDNAEILPGVMDYIEAYNGPSEEESGKSGKEALSQPSESASKILEEINRANEERKRQEELKKKQEEVAKKKQQKESQKNPTETKQKSKEEMEKTRIAEKKRREAKVKEYKSKIAKASKKSTLKKVKDTVVKVAKATGKKVSEYASKGAKYIEDFFDKL